MGKSISKAFKKVVGGALNTVGLGPDAPKAPEAQDAPVAAAPAEVPATTVTDVDTDVTAQDQKKQRAVGKRGLQVSRTSGGGLSI